jgi:hypothetical protein
MIFFFAFDLQYLLEMFAKSLYSKELIILIKIFMLLHQSLQSPSGWSVKPYLW